MIRGIGDPLVAAYARCYLCRVGMNLSKNQVFVKENLYDFISSYGQLNSRCVLAELERQGVSNATYHTLFVPALDFILQLAAVHEPERFLEQLLSK